MVCEATVTSGGNADRKCNQLLGLRVERSGLMAAFASSANGLAMSGAPARTLAMRVSVCCTNSFQWSIAMPCPRSLLEGSFRDIDCDVFP